jgi:hypothetical protein
MLTLPAVARLARASEGVVRDAIELGLVRTAWRDRRLHIEAASGRLWAERYRAVAPARKPVEKPLPTPAAAADPGPHAGDVDGDIDIDTPIRPKRDRKARVRLDPLIEPALPGERVWTISELAEAAGLSRNIIINAVQAALLAVVSPTEETRPYLICDRAAQKYLRQRAERIEQIRQRKARRV